MEELRSKGMFGGYGLYQGEFFFGIVDKDRLYFKIDEETRQRYEAHGMEPLKCSLRQTMRSYYEVPGGFIEYQEELLQWAKQAVNARKNSKK